MKLFGYGVLVFIGLLVLNGCIDKDNINDDENLSTSSNNKTILKTYNKSIKYSYLTLKIEGDIQDIKAKVNDIEYLGIKNKDTFFIFNLALKEGNNKIELSANDGSEKQTIEINSEGKGIPPIGISVDKQEGFEKLDTTLSIHTTLSVSEYMLDKGNNGVIDERKGDASFSVSYDVEGRFFPVVTVKTSDGTLYSTQKNISLDVKAKPIVQELSSLSSLDVIDMQIFSNEKYYILTDSAVYEINTSNDIVKTININANNPEGFFVDLDENIFIANTGANQVIRLSKADSYQQTMAFGSTGSAKGEFNQLKDLVIEDRGENQKIYVLDAGNNRIQVFNYVGAYLYSFDGSSTPTGKLNNPTSMVGYFAQPLVIVDSGNGVIRTLQCSQGQQEHEVSVIKDGISSDIGKISIGNNLIVADKGAKKILFFQNNYWLKKSLNVDKIPNVAISNDGLNILISNDGESGVSKTKISIDPKGAEPMDVAKEFVKSLIDGDRATVERLVGNSQKSIDIIYGNQTNLNNAINLYKQITSWHSQTYHTTSYATVKAHIKTATDEFDATFELTVADTQIKTSRIWIVKRFY
ncbi:MAG: hypothetical protein GXO30_08585 [Epsilonproteobacteria bacterium]|nr:hypothetical protein [Campylobacterota bacterium]